MYQSAESGQDLDSSSIEISQHVTEPILSEQQKYRKAFQVAQSLSQQLSTFGMRDFTDGLETLESLSRIWGKGKRAIVVVWYCNSYVYSIETIRIIIYMHV